MSEFLPKLNTAASNRSETIVNKGLQMLANTPKKHYDEEKILKVEFVMILTISRSFRKDH